MDGSCWDRFGRKTLLTFTGYKERVPGVMSELNRIGMKNVNVQWQFPSPFDNVLLKNLKCLKCLETEKGSMNLAMGHYSAIKTAYHLDLDSVLVIEDDIRFLNDTDKISAIVSSLPESFDIAMFDYSGLAGFGSEDAAEHISRLRKTRCVNSMWAEFDFLTSTGCYALSRRAMKSYIWLVEAAVTNPKIGKLRPADHWFNRKYMGSELSMLFASVPVAIQRRVSSDGIHPELDLGLHYSNVVGADIDKYAL